MYNYTCDQVDIKHARKEFKLNQQTGESCTCSAQKKNSIFTWKKISRGYALKDLKYFTANHISESLNISRNLASQYLNELVKEERAIKVNSRPVYFFHKKNVEREAQVALETCVFSGMDDFQRKCRSDENKRDFQKAIGYYLSLSSCIEQCKAAVKYPPNGLPALFNGAGGTGKAFLSRLMYEYAVNERVIGTAGAASLPPLHHSRLLRICPE